MDRAKAIEKKLASKQAALARAKKEAEAKKKAIAKAAAEAKARAKAEATRRANAAAERQAAAEREAAAQRRQSLPTQTYQAPIRKPTPKVGGNPYPGYTGPRCYAPGGQSWKPC